MVPYVGANGGAAAGACEPDAAGGGRRTPAPGPHLRPAHRPPASQPHRPAAQARLHTGHPAASAAADSQTGQNLEANPDFTGQVISDPKNFRI